MASDQVAIAQRDWQVCRVPARLIHVSQTGVIFWALFVGFVVYVTIKGRLPLYINVIYAKAPASATGNTATLTQPQVDTLHSGAGSGLPGLAPGYGLGVVPGI